MNVFLSAFLDGYCKSRMTRGPCVLLVTLVPARLLLFAGQRKRSNCREQRVHLLWHHGVTERLQPLIAEGWVARDCPRRFPQLLWLGWRGRPAMSVQPRGKPISISTNSGFSCPCTWLESERLCPFLSCGATMLPFSSACGVRHS